MTLRRRKEVLLKQKGIDRFLDNEEEFRNPQLSKEASKTQIPKITRFYGIIIKMFFKLKEHEPSHIHALYGEYIGIFDVKTSKMTDGDLPSDTLLEYGVTIHSE